MADVVTVTTQPTTDQIAERVLVLLAEKVRERNSVPDGLMPAVQYISAVQAEAPPGVTQGTVEDKHWIFHGLGTELRLIPKMYFDPRYRVSRLAQLGVPIGIVLVIVNYVFFNFPPLSMVPVFPAILERIVLLLLGVLIYKVLSREVARYKQVLSYLKQYG